MAEPDKRQIGDGSDNYGEAAKQMAKAAKEAGIETAKQAAVKGAEAGANAAAATVQAGVEGGKAVAEIAAGTAAGGPWGAILSAAWAMRHTLFKILVCISILDYTPPHAAAPFLQTETTSPHAASEERPHTSSIPSKRRTLYSSAKPPSEF